MFVLYLSINTRALAAMLPTLGKLKYILKYECVNNDFGLLIKESLLIGKYKPNLNKQINTFQLSLF